MITLQGEAKLLARIAKVKKEKGLYKLACREAAKIVAAEVKNQLPKLTGTTAKNVKVRSAGGKILGAKVVVGIPGTQTYRGWFLEHGTTARYTKKGAFRGALQPGNYVANATRNVEASATGRARDIIAAKVFE